MKFKAAMFLTVTRAVGFSYTRRSKPYDDAQTCPIRMCNVRDATQDVRNGNGRFIYIYSYNRWLPNI